MFSDRIYLTALSITGMMILPAYLFTGMFLWKISRRNHRAGVLTGAGCTLFCAWMIYAGGLELFLETSIFYLLGLGFYIKVLREQQADSPLMRRGHLLSAGSIAGIVVLSLAGVASVFLLFS